MQVPFNKSYLTGHELSYMQQALEQQQLAGGGTLSREVAAGLAQALGIEKLYLVTSGTAALEMAALLAGIEEGHEIIMPSFTFVSTANAFILRQARPVFADINPFDLNLNLDDVYRKLTHRTRALVPVHYAGLPCPMDRLVSLAADAGLKIIEDAAHALYASYQGKAAGSWGDFGCFSFHATKNIICGEGGALAVNDTESQARADIIWQKGTDREKFVRKEVAFYSWQDVGSSFPPSELLVAFLKAQLEQAELIQQRRRRIWETYARELRPLVESGQLMIQRLDPKAESSYHIFYILLSDELKRQRLETYLGEKEIGVAFHYIPLHVSPMGRRLGYRPGDLPVTEKAAACLLRLPLYPDLAENEQSYVIEQLKKAMVKI